MPAKILIVSADRPVDDTYRPPSVTEMLLQKFEECATCAAKPGSPPLCPGCLHNRSLIYALQSKVTETRDTLKECHKAHKRREHGGVADGNYRQQMQKILQLRYPI